MKKRILSVFMAICLMLTLLPTATLAANAENAIATDGSETVIATVEHDAPGALDLDTNIVVRIYLNGDLVGQTAEFVTKRAANHVEVHPTDDGWYYDRYTFSEGNGTWDVGGTLTCHDSDVTLDVYYTSENLSTGTVYTLVERVDENAELQNGQSSIVGITATRTLLDTSRNGTVNVYVDDVLRESVSVTLGTNSAWHLTLNYDRTKYSFDSFGKAGEGYYYATEDTLYAASFAPGDNFEWNIYFTSSSTGTQIVNGYLGEAELNDTFQIQEVPNPVSADVLPGGTATVRVYISDVLMYEDTSVQTRDGTNYYYLSFDTTDYELDLFKATRADGTDIARAESLSTLNSMYFHIPDGATVEIWLVPVESFAFDVERYEYLRSTNTGSINTGIADSVDISWTYNGHDFSYTVSGSAWTSFLLRLPRNTNITIRPNMNMDAGWVCWGWALPESLGTSASLIDEEGNPENDRVEVGFIGALNPAGGDGTVTLVVREEGIEATSVMLRLYGIHYRVADFEKELVTEPTNTVNLPDDVTISYPDANGTVQVDAEDDTVTLLYRLTVTGQAGTSFTVTDEDATLVAQSGFTQSDNAITGTIPDGGVAQFYVYKTFTVTADTTVTNTATIEVNGDVPEDEDIAPGEEEDSEETPIEKDEEGGGDLADNQIAIEVYLDGQQVEDGSTFSNYVSPASGTASDETTGIGAWNADLDAYVYTYGVDTQNSAYVDLTVTHTGTDTIVQGIEAVLVYGDGDPDIINQENAFDLNNVTMGSTVKIYLNTVYTVAYSVPTGTAEPTDGGKYITVAALESNDNGLPVEGGSSVEYRWINGAVGNDASDTYHTQITLAAVPDGLDVWSDESNNTYSGGSRIDLTTASMDVLDANADRTITFTAQETGSADITVTKDVTNVGDTAIPADATQDDIPAALAGDVIEWTITVENVGGEPQTTNVTITENLDGAKIARPAAGDYYTVSDDGTTITVSGLPVGGTETITVTYTVTAADVEAGAPIANSVTVTEGDDPAESEEKSPEVPVAEADILDVPKISHQVNNTGPWHHSADTATVEHLVTTTNPTISYQAVLDLSKMDLQDTSNTNQSVGIFGSIFDVMSTETWNKLKANYWGLLDYDNTIINLYVDFDDQLVVDYDDMQKVTVTSPYFERTGDPVTYDSKTGYWKIPCKASEQVGTGYTNPDEVILSGITLNLTSAAQSALNTSKVLTLTSGGYIDGTVTFDSYLSGLTPLTVYGEATDDKVNLAMDANGDNIADKYQVTVNYTAGTGGRITGKTVEVLTIRDGDGNLATSGSVTATGSTASASANYSFRNWTDGAGAVVGNSTSLGQQTIQNAQGGSTYTFTANFAYNGGGSDPGTGGSETPDDYTIIFESNGGTEFDDITEDHSFYLNVYDDDEYGSHIPSRPGYRFTGWYRDSNLQTRISEDNDRFPVTGSTVRVWAGWEESSVPSMLNGDDHFAYIQGYADGTVRPNANITRAQVATIFFRLLDEDVRDDSLTTTNPFPDVDEDYWANTAISTMAALGVINGRNNGNFDPDASITRAEFAAICARFDDSGVTGTAGFTDISGHWAEAEIERAAALGWVQGYSDGSFQPNARITRAQAVTMINRVLCRLPEDADDLLPGMNTWTDCHQGDWYYLAIQEATNSHDYVAKDRVYETWTSLNADPDWSRYE